MKDNEEIDTSNLENTQSYKKDSSVKKRQVNSLIIPPQNTNHPSSKLNTVYKDTLLGLAFDPESFKMPYMSVSKNKLNFNYKNEKLNISKAINKRF